MNLIEFIKQYANRKNAFTKVILEWVWLDDGVDEEYCFEGLPSDFLKKYVEEYDCIKGLDIFDVRELSVKNDGLRSSIYIQIVRE